jgi:hypothetical protein
MKHFIELQTSLYLNLVVVFTYKKEVLLWCWNFEMIRKNCEANACVCAAAIHSMFDLVLW